MFEQALAVLIQKGWTFSEGQPEHCFLNIFSFLLHRKCFYFVQLVSESDA